MTHYRTATARNTCFTKCAAVSTMRHVLHAANTPRPLHEYVTINSSAHCSQRLAQGLPQVRLIDMVMDRASILLFFVHGLSSWHFQYLTGHPANLFKRYLGRPL